jgi:hypothetical protein
LAAVLSLAALNGANLMNSCRAEDQIHDRAQAVWFAKKMWRSEPRNSLVEDAMQLESFENGWRQDLIVNGTGWLVGLTTSDPPAWSVNYRLQDETKQVALFAIFTKCGRLLDSGAMGYPR